MSFSVSPELKKILARVRAVVDEDVIPLEKQFTGTFGALEPALARVRSKVKAAGLWAPYLPKDLGGLGLPLLDYARVSEVLGRTPLGHYAFNCQAPDVGNLEILHRFGTDAQKARWLGPLASGEARSCFSMTEPERPGSNPTWMETRAREDGGDWVIDGHKWFTSSADGAAFAIVMAVTDPDAPRHLRASQIIVPLPTPGFTLVRNVSVMGHRGDGWASHAEVRYDGVRVPRENLLGGRGLGFAIAQDRLGPGRIHHCMRWIGICERALDLMCRHVAERELSPGKPLGTRQIVQAWIAESRAEINASRLLVLDCAAQIDEVGAHDARESISLIKFYVAGVLGQVLDRAVQAHGALGLSDDTPLAAWWRNERAARVYDGPDEVHKMSVAKRILRGYGVDVK